VIQTSLEIYKKENIPLQNIFIQKKSSTCLSYHLHGVLGKPIKSNEKHCDAKYFKVNEPFNNKKLKKYCVEKNHKKEKCKQFVKNEKYVPTIQNKWNFIT